MRQTGIRIQDSRFKFDQLWSALLLVDDSLVPEAPTSPVFWCHTTYMYPRSITVKTRLTKPGLLSWLCVETPLQSVSACKISGSYHFSSWKTTRMWCYYRWCISYIIFIIVIFLLYVLLYFYHMYCYIFITCILLYYIHSLYVFHYIIYIHYMYFIILSFYYMYCITLLCISCLKRHQTFKEYAV